MSPVVTFHVINAKVTQPESKTLFRSLPPGGEVELGIVVISRIDDACRRLRRFCDVRGGESTPIPGRL